MIALLSNDFEGIVPNSNIDDIDAFKVNETVKLNVAKIDVDNKKIILMPPTSKKDNSSTIDDSEENNNPDELEEEN